MSFNELHFLPLFSCFWAVIAGPTPRHNTASSVSSSVPFNDGRLSENVEYLPSTTTKATTSKVDSDNYLNRLDFISVIVICAIVAFCFGICVIIGCRRKKRNPSQLDITDSQPQSITESRSEPRTSNFASARSDLRVPESPPPTYSIIERQTSFTSYVSQTSSHYEIPPDYEEALSFGDSTNGEPYSHRPSRPGSRTGSDRSVGRFAVKDNPGARPNRSESARARGPPRSHAYRSSSDVARTRRARLSSRPATVSEDDSSQCSVTNSALTTNSAPHKMSAGGTRQSINVIAEVEPASEAHALNSEHIHDLAEVAQPLLPISNIHGTESDVDDANSVASSQKKDSSMMRKLTLV